MTTEKKNNRCRKIRNWLYQVVSSRFGIDADWVHNHIATCPRCQRRTASIGKVNLALSLIKSQSHKLDLLSRANAQAISVLKHSLQAEPKARELKAAQPEPKLLERCAKYRQPATNLAACITVLLLMKTGVFSSMDKFQQEGQRTMKHYYAQAGQDLADEIFSA